MEAFLSWLANERNVAVSTLRQALSALLVLYQKVLGPSLPWMEAIGRPRREPRLPVMPSVDEVTRILALLQDEQRLFAQLLYGTGIRITEALQLRVKDVDFEQRTIVIRAGKGGKDRSVMLPLTLVPALRDELARARVLWSTDVAAGRSGVSMPRALDRKYPRAGASWAWFWVFPQTDHSVDPRSGVVRRHHMYDQTFQRAFKRAVERGGVNKPATPHTLRALARFRIEQRRSFPTISDSVVDLCQRCAGTRKIGTSSRFVWGSMCRASIESKVPRPEHPTFPEAHMFLRTSLFAAAKILLAVAMSLVIATAEAQQGPQAKWPQRPVRIIVPYAAGGNTDGIARVTSQALGETFGQSFVVENKVGGNGTVAAEFVARAQADGYTLFMVAQPVFAIVPAMIKAPYDPVADFAPISIVGTNQFALGVHKSVPANTLADLIAYVKSKPSGSLNYSSGSIASVSHLVMELLLVRAAIKVEHVPFKGGSQSLQSLVSGQTPMGFNNVSEVIPFAKSGEIRLLAVSGSRRAAQLPEVPTVAESGFPGFNAQTWNGLVGPAKLPREIVDRIAAEVRRRVKDPVFAQRMGGLGVDLLGTTPEEFAATIRADIALWAEAVRASGAKVE